jgi:hypothetical protein
MRLTWHLNLAAAREQEGDLGLGEWPRQAMAKNL